MRDILQANLAAVDEVLVLAAAEGAAGDGDLGVFGRQPVGAVVEGDRDLGHAGGRFALPAGEDDVLGLLAAQGGVTLLAEHPADAIGDVRLAGAVRSDDRGDATLEGEDGPIRETLEAMKFEPGQPRRGRFEGEARQSLGGAVDRAGGLRIAHLGSGDWSARGRRSPR